MADPYLLCPIVNKMNFYLWNIPPFTFLNKTSIGELLWNFAYENITYEISVLFKISDFLEVTLFLIKLIQTSEFDLLKCLCFISKNI